VLAQCRLLITDADENRWLYLGFQGVFGGLLWMRPHMRKRFKREAEWASLQRVAAFGPSLRTLGLTVLFALPFPLVFLFLGWRLQLPFMDMPLAERFPFSFLLMGKGLFYGLFFMHVCRPEGLAEAHFQWARHDTERLRRGIRWLIPLVLPIGFFIYLLEGVFVENLSNRLFFIPSMFVFAIFLHRMLHPRKGLTFGRASGRPAAWQPVLHGVAVGIPILLAAAAAAGFTYTARKFWLCVAPTIWLAFLIVLSRSLVLHWVLILPNREFITNGFINWSLSDTIVRLICKVGVSYRADVRLVNDLLLRIARAEPSVLKDPPPSVLLMQFGESTLNFELRAFVDSPDIRLSTAHRLNMAIVESFREAGIEIAFPQRDLHVRSLPEGFPPAS